VKITLSIILILISLPKIPSLPQNSLLKKLQKKYSKMLIKINSLESKTKSTLDHKFGDFTINQEQEEQNSKYLNTILKDLNLNESESKNFIVVILLIHPKKFFNLKKYDQKILNKNNQNLEMNINKTKKRIEIFI